MNRTTLFCAALSLLLGACYLQAETPPYPSSQVIDTFTWDWSTCVDAGPGSDQWPATWADDDNLYLTWGDGGGFNGDNSNGRVSMGVARIEGTPLTWTGINVWGGVNPESTQTTVEGKVPGLLCINGVLYVWQNKQNTWDNARILVSSDHGMSWTIGDFILEYPLNRFTPIQFGKDYADAPDNYVYGYFTNDDGISICLSRVPVTGITQRSSYEFFAGLDANQQPTWSANIANKQAVFIDSVNKVNWGYQCVYNDKLGVYLLTVTHGGSGEGPGLGIFDAPNPWGPWATAYFTDQWKDDKNKFCFTFPRKWMSTNGLEGWMIHSGWPEYDGYHHVKYTVTLKSGAPYPPSAVITDVSFDWSTHVELCPGSDNWPVTWADDDKQYASWGDGGGFNGSNSDGRVSLGFARIEGDWSSFTGYNVWGGKNPENPATFDGKSYGIICIAGTFYAWWGPGSNSTSFGETRMLQSTDHGAIWTKSSWDLHDIDPSLVMPTICNFGKNYAGARDGYVYSYFIEKHVDSLAVQQPGNIYLARVPTDKTMDITQYEWFTGVDANNVPSWSADVADKVAVFNDSKGVG